ncbi:MAG: hypothetical protein ACPL2D_02260 [Ignavibacteria bacterium]
MKPKNFYFILLLTLSFLLFSCHKKEEEPQQQLPPQTEISSDKEKELRDKEELLRIKEQQLKEWEERLAQRDSGKTLHIETKDTTKLTKKDTVKVKDLKKQKLEEKEKELNKRLDNPKVAIEDYLDYIKRAISDSKTFDANLKKASQIWENRSYESFKKSYTGVKKFVVETEPKVVSQKGNTATVSVKIKQTVSKNGKDEEKEITVTYNLIVDEKGKWKIRSNIVK